jgi:prepilin-type N-terminal cleavage/methylation domain-containing protein
VSRIRAAALRDESGLTLVELLIVMVIGAVVMSGMTAIAVNTYRATRTVDVNTADQLQALTALSVMTRDLRAAAPVRPSNTPAFLVARPNEAVFTANIETSTRPVQITIRLEADGRVVEEFVLPNEGALPDVGWDTANPQVRYITSFVVNAVAGEPMLRYFDQSGTELVPGATGLTEQQRRNVAAVELNLLVSGDPSGQTSRFAAESRVRLPNADRQANAGGG